MEENQSISFVRTSREIRESGKGGGKRRMKLCNVKLVGIYSEVGHEKEVEIGSRPCLLFFLPIGQIHYEFMGRIQGNIRRRGTDGCYFNIIG